MDEQVTVSLTVHPSLSVDSLQSSILQALPALQSVAQFDCCGLSSKLPPGTSIKWVEGIWLPESVKRKHLTPTNIRLRFGDGRSFSYECAFLDCFWEVFTDKRQGGGILVYRGGYIRIAVLTGRRRCFYVADQNFRGSVGGKSSPPALIWCLKRAIEDAGHNLTNAFQGAANGHRQFLTTHTFRRQKANSYLQALALTE